MAPLGHKFVVVRATLRYTLVAILALCFIPIAFTLVQFLRGKQSSLYSELAVGLNPNLEPAIIAMVAAYAALSFLGAVAFALNNRKAMLCVSILILIGLGINLSDRIFNDNFEARKLRSELIADHLRPMVLEDWLGWPLNMLQKLQFAEQCCGIDGPQDWSRVRPFGWQSDWYPLTCCPIESKATCTGSRVFRKGCYEKIAGFAEAAGAHVEIVLIIQLLLGLSGLAVVWMTPKPQSILQEQYQQKQQRSLNNNYRHFFNN